MTRLVLDANIVLSGLAAPTGPPGRLLRGAREQAFVSIICPRLLAEVARGLRKPYFRVRVPLGRAAFRTYVDAAAELPDPTRSPPLLRDPRDDYLVALARAGEAVAIVSGDRDLLDHAGLAPPAIDARTACRRFRL
ncbi:putative toxin-antitoxin system toxin component, PIN family [Conexibacter sp. JD483]|uniref:putative toxin-antitoxin system toxin component, PIN family n=1 Tax=unclassified Conexibacter TaxID=2627773 RepID=UPI00271F0B35|nr:MULTISPECIES: putative toxin-antitoxin system toxin component, PIN family [unclassified Conexibacter]MDO8184127.1 putative toxin-antitoxin system toxin component, PIN family [Conexibacter sp. CPCC 205706]MDO8197119.1 putative toxin-antitoxin system toxin component, PIN family [Conexibacter sp. CPCC 205762]MDR9367566.1 putative toxin-antitoxin system toxin component, PIN family [Conexibacter sp. JD483]